MNSYNLFIDYINRINRGMSTLSSIIFFVIMLLTIYEIISRLFSLPYIAGMNLSELLFVVGVYFGIGYTQLTKTNVAVEFLVSRFSMGTQKILKIFNLILPICICTLLLLIGWGLALESWQVREKMDGEPFYPIYPVKFSILLGIFLLLIQFIADLLKEAKHYFLKSDYGKS